MQRFASAGWADGLRGGEMGFVAIMNEPFLQVAVSGRTGGNVGSPYINKRKRRGLADTVLGEFRIFFGNSCRAGGEGETERRGALLKGRFFRVSVCKCQAAFANSA
jgi:hypothetical protein